MYLNREFYLVNNFERKCIQKSINTINGTQQYRSDHEQKEASNQTRIDLFHHMGNSIC